MAFGVDATGHLAGNAVTTDPKTWTHVNGASANKLVVMMGGGTSVANERDIDSATYNAVSMGTRVAHGNDAGWTSVSIFVKDTPATGSNTVSVSNVANHWNQNAGFSISFNDAAAGTVNAGNATGTSANPSTTATGIQSGDIVVACISNDSAASGITAGGTLIFEDEDVSSDTDYSAQYYVATGTSQVISWTQSDSGSGWSIAWVAIRGTGGGGSTELPSLVMPPMIPAGYRR